MLAIVRPDEWNLPLLIHVGGAMVLVGALVAAAATFLVATRSAGPGGSPAYTRLGFRALALGAVPAYVVMRVGAQWIASEQDLADSDAAWIGIGYITTDAGVLLLLAATVIAWIAARRAGSGAARAWPDRVAPALTLLLVAVYLVAIWAMTAKPA